MARAPAAGLALAMLALICVANAPASAQHHAQQQQPSPPPSSPPPPPPNKAARPAALVSPRDACVSAPSAPSCAGYVYPPRDAAADLARLCGAMPFMAGCSVRAACNASAGGGAVSSRRPDACEPFQALAHVCGRDTGMSRMGGCESYNSLCAAGSAVRACAAADALAPIPPTEALNREVRSVCEEMTMDGCERCTPSWRAGRTWADCDLLGVYGLLCAQMPDMSQCGEWAAMCAADPTLVFCHGSAPPPPPPGPGPPGPKPSPGPSPAKPPVMKMYFFTELPFYLLFRSWTPSDGPQLAGAWLAIFALGLAYEFLQALYGRYEAAFWARRHRLCAAAARGASAARRAAAAADLENGVPLGEGVEGEGGVNGGGGGVGGPAGGLAPCCMARSNGAAAAAAAAVAAPVVVQPLAGTPDNGSASSASSGGGKGHNGGGGGLLQPLRGRRAAGAAAAAGRAAGAGALPPGGGGGGCCGDGGGGGGGGGLAAPGKGHGGGGGGGGGGCCDPSLLAMDAVRGLARCVLAGLAYLMMLAAMSFNVAIFTAVVAGVGVGSALFGRWRYSAGMAEGYSHCGCGSA